MSSSYIGSYTIGGSVVGLSGAFSAVGTALTNLTAAVDAQLAAIEDASAALLDAKAAIRIPATADFQAQFNASVDISANISGYLTDPSAYLSGLLAGIGQVEANIGALDPTVALNTQLSVNTSIQASLEAKIAAVDLQLEALVTISLALDAIRAALQVAIDAVGAALDIVASMTTTLGTAGAQVFRVDAPLGNVGAELDAVTPLSGIGAGVNVQVYVMLVQASDTPAVVATNAVFRTS